MACPRFTSSREFDRAFAGLADGRRIFQEIGSSRLIANTTTGKACLRCGIAHPEHARETRNQQLQMARAFGREDEIGWGLWELGRFIG
ncbi:MAG: hypothetical protein IPL78_18050 [Chloroflexi bacterium]|nr:hypothetical protein [Chloroflexota bacterium]